MLSPMQKKVALALKRFNVSNANSVGPGTGPSSKVRNNSFVLVLIRQVSAGKSSGSMKGVRNTKNQELTVGT
jgi:hypothetical protein